MRLGCDSMNFPLLLGMKPHQQIQKNGLLKPLVVLMHCAKT